MTTPEAQRPPDAPALPAPGPAPAEAARARVPGRAALRCVRSLLAEGLPGRGFAALLLTVQQIAGVSSGIAIFLALIAHVQHELGSASPRFDRLVPAGLSDTGRLLVTVAVTLVLGLTGAWCLYASRRGLLRLVRGFHLHLIESALASLERADQVPARAEVVFVSRKHDERYLAPVYARYVASAFRILLESLHPAIVALAAVGALLYLDPALTVAMTPMAALMWALLRRLGGQAAAAQGRFLEGSSELNPELLRLGSEIAKGQAGDGRGEVSRAELDASLDRVLDDHYHPLLLLQRASSRTQVVLTLGLVWLLLVVGLGLGRSGSSWAGLLGFVIALRFLAGALRTLAVSTISFARYVPAIETFWTLVFDRSLERGAAGTGPAAAPPGSSS